MTPSMSPTIGELAKALASAQKAFPPIRRTRTAKIQTAKASYSYDYADLSDVIDGVKSVLSDNGLAYSQPIVSRDGQPELMTVLMHTSGEWIASSCPVRGGNTPQELGASITYARRYGLTAVLGIATEEDNDAAGVEPKSEPVATPTDPDADRLRDLVAKAVADKKVTPEQAQEAAIAHNVGTVDALKAAPAEVMRSLVKSLGLSELAPVASG